MSKRVTGRTSESVVTAMGRRIHFNSPAASPMTSDPLASEDLSRSVAIGRPLSLRSLELNKDKKDISFASDYEDALDEKYGET